MPQEFERRSSLPTSPRFIPGEGDAPVQIGCELRRRRPTSLWKNPYHNHISWAEIINSYPDDVPELSVQTMPND
ncbi:hypothetical protein HMPREF0043_00048 [Actinobaculum sp. oral taxon 183 str. F0552]|nr:hypothetical protein HMPREF0043_00048 [Actinobaculum sp. oral taxon 183 str. F0552]